MAAVSQKTFSNAFSSEEMFNFRLKFHRSLFLNGPINNVTALVQIMAWRRPGDKLLQKFDIHWHDGGPSIAMMCHLRRVSDLLCNWKSCLLCYMKDVVLHCSIFFKWNILVRVRVRVLSEPMMVRSPTDMCITRPQWVNHVVSPSDQQIWHQAPLCLT